MKVSTNLFLKIPKDLKKEILGLAQKRKFDEQPNSTITDVVIEFVRQGLDKERKKSQEKNRQTFSDL
jgi:DNA polymerase III delta subunit